MRTSQYVVEADDWRVNKSNRTTIEYYLQKQKNKVARDFEA